MNLSDDLARGGVHVWLRRPEDVAAVDLLDEEETARHRRYVRRADRDLFGAAHVHLRSVLSRYVPEADPAAWRFERGPHGRPEPVHPAAPAGLRANMSHTSGLVAVVVSVDAACGVDVETAGRVADPMQMARRFSPGHLAALAGAADPGDLFLKIWTLGEAYIKATGAGLTTPLDAFTFELDADPPTIAFHHGLVDDPSGWSFRHTRPTPRHHLAVAVASGGASVRIVGAQQASSERAAAAISSGPKRTSASSDGA